MSNKNRLNKRGKIYLLLLILTILPLLILSIIIISSINSGYIKESVNEFAIESINENSNIEGNSGNILDVIVLNNTISSGSSNGRRGGGGSFSSNNLCNGGIGSPDKECQDHGFDFGIKKYQCGSTTPENGSHAGDYNISVIWNNCISVNWTSNPGVGGVLSKEGYATYNFSGGTSGIITKICQDISHITFCGYNQTEYCGDGNLDNGEECDLGELNGVICGPPYDGNCTYCSDECKNITLYNGFCGDNIINGDEECELPETANNSFCCQTTEECLGNKLGTRDGVGYCDVDCGCVEDNFEYSCVKGECGAQCESDEGCENNNCYESYDDYCQDKKLVDYNANSISDSFEVEDDCENTCDLEGDCSCSDCEVDCSAEPLTHCVKDICGAECEFDIDCDDEDENTIDTCEGCVCKYQQLPYCGDGNLDDGEECDDGNNEDGDGCSVNCMIEYKCDEDSDCGEDGFIDDQFCVCTTNVWDWWVTYECVKPGQINSYCINTTEMKLREECGSDYCDDWENICYNNDVYEGRDCYDNGCKSGECFSNSYIQKEFVEDCGYDYCEYNWNYYCEGNDVYRERTCYDKGCDAGVCFVDDYIEDELFSECSDECIDGRCYDIECYTDEDCPEDGYMGNEFCWCNKLFDYYIDYSCVEGGSVDSYCGSSTKLEIVGICDGIYCTV